MKGRLLLLLLLMAVVAVAAVVVPASPAPARADEEARRKAGETMTTQIKKHTTPQAVGTTQQPNE
jgi:hypothetical protein